MDPVDAIRLARERRESIAAAEHWFAEDSAEEPRRIARAEAMLTADATVYDVMVALCEDAQTPPDVLDRLHVVEAAILLLADVKLIRGLRLQTARAAVDELHGPRGVSVDDAWTTATTNCLQAGIPIPRLDRSWKP